MAQRRDLPDAKRRVFTHFFRVVVWLAEIKLLFAILGAFVTALAGLRGSPILFLVSLLLILVYGGIGAFLCWSGRGDQRALLLGAVLLLSPTPYADLRILDLIRAVPSLSILGGLAALQLVALSPFFLWLFVQDFPKSPTHGPLQRLFLPAQILSGALGVALLIINLEIYFAREPLPAWRMGLGRHSDIFWLLLFLAVLPALGVMLFNGRFAPENERRRVSLFIGSLVTGFFPISVGAIAMVLIPAVRGYGEGPSGLLVTGIFIYPPLMVAPLVIAYSVVVDRVLDTRLVIRKALQYSLTRYSPVGITAVPFSGLLIFLYSNRERTLLQLLEGSQLIVLSAALGAGLLALRYRKRLVTGLDRRFFRERYDSHDILAGLIDHSRNVSDTAELDELLTRELELALHNRSFALLVLDERTASLKKAGGNTPSLDLTSNLAEILADYEEPVLITADTLSSLPPSDQDWLEAGGFQLIVPLIGAQGALIGVLALGPKRSELPYSEQDRSLLLAIGQSVSMTLESRMLEHTTSSSDESIEAGSIASWLPDYVGVHSEDAAECERCGTVFDPDVEQCDACETQTIRCRLPFLLAGKYRVEKRIGQGGMGVVYLARDTSLRRPVAIKALPKANPRYSLRMRREAQAIAAVRHNNLALIHAVETWCGAPVLVFEYLPDGTLAQRLRRGCLSISDTLQLGITLASALHELHQAGVLHRDIKPSNIAFDGVTPKILDFGLAKILIGARPSSELGLPRNRAATDSTATFTLSGKLVGTPLYMSPEVFQQNEADPGVDLWSLNVVLYECLAGRHPFHGLAFQEIATRVVAGEIPDIGESQPGCSLMIRSYFGAALSKHQTERPPSAKAMMEQLEGIQNQLSPG